MEKNVQGKATVGNLNYNDVVSTLREAARDELRLVKTNSVRAQLFSLNSDMNKLNEVKKELEKDLTCNKYDLSKVDAADPRAEDYKTGLAEDLKVINAEMENLNKEITAVEEAIKDRTAKLADVQSGAWKVSIESLDLIVNRMIVDRSKAVVAKLD